MNKFTSTYLNFLRVFAALMVFFGHTLLGFFSRGAFDFIKVEHFGHNFVMIFFVLSGFLIAFSTDIKKNDSLTGYFVSRFSRIYTIAVPAIIFTLIIDSIGLLLEKACYLEQMNLKMYYVRYVITLLSLNELWLYSSKLSTNSPFWSLAYEFWYYIIFGVAMLYKQKYKLLLVLAITLFVGIKIMILMPVWLLGVLAYYLKNSFDTKINMILFTLTLFLGCAYLWGMFELPFPVYYKHGYYPLYRSNDFLNDYFIGVIFAANIYFSKGINLSFGSGVNAVANWLSAGTFTLYLFHFPILVFISCVCFKDHNPSLFTLIGVECLILLILFIAGNYLEQSRKYYQVFFSKMFNLIKKN